MEDLNTFFKTDKNKLIEKINIVERTIKNSNNVNLETNIKTLYNSSTDFYEKGLYSFLIGIRVGKTYISKTSNSAVMFSNIMGLKKEELINIVEYFDSNKELQSASFGKVAQHFMQSDLGTESGWCMFLNILGTSVSNAPYIGLYEEPNFSSQEIENIHTEMIPRLKREIDNDDVATIAATIKTINRNNTIGIDSILNIPLEFIIKNNQNNEYNVAEKIIKLSIGVLSFLYKNNMCTDSDFKDPIQVGLRLNINLLKCLKICEHNKHLANMSSENNYSDLRGLATIILENDYDFTEKAFATYVFSRGRRFEERFK